jgi:hypothetical protein
MPRGHQQVHEIFPGNAIIGERPLTGRIWLQKWIEAEQRWADMSAGEARTTAAKGHELDHIKRQAKAIEGRCRIVKRSTSGAVDVVWPECEREP